MGSPIISKRGEAVNIESRRLAGKLWIETGDGGLAEDYCGGEESVDGYPTLDDVDEHFSRGSPEIVTRLADGGDAGVDVVDHGEVAKAGDGEVDGDGNADFASGLDGANGGEVTATDKRSRFNGGGQQGFCTGVTGLFVEVARLDHRFDERIFSYGAAEAFKAVTGIEVFFRAAEESNASMTESDEVVDDGFDRAGIVDAGAWDRSLAPLMAGSDDRDAAVGEGVEDFELGWSGQNEGETGDVV